MIGSFVPPQCEEDGSYFAFTSPRKHGLYLVCPFQNGDEMDGTRRNPSFPTKAIQLHTHVAFIFTPASVIQPMDLTKRLNVTPLLLAIAGVSMCHMMELRFKDVEEALPTQHKVDCNGGISFSSCQQQGRNSKGLIGGFCTSL